MNNTGMIIDFLEGTLDSAKEDELFMMLNSNESFRGDFKQYVSMDKAFNKKLSTMAPSTKSTMGVFSALGISVPLTAPVKNLSQNPVNKFQKVFGKYSQGIISGIVATVLTSTAFLLFFGHSIFNNSVSDSFANKSTQNKFIPEIKKDIPVISSKINDNIPVVKTKIIYVPTPMQTSVVSNSSEEMPTSSIDKPKTQDIPTISKISDSSIEPTFEIAQNQFDNNLSSTLIIDSNFEPTIEPEKVYNTQFGLSLQLNGAQYWQLNQVTIEQSSVPKFHNNGISIFYNVFDDISLCFDVRNEHFYQEFEGIDNIGDKFLYRQYPNYINYSGGFKWNFFHYNALSSYSQLMIGGTKTGITSRGVLGLEYTPFPLFTFVVGLEGSFLRYTHQGNAFYSPKLGLNYGVLFNF